jgi:hypothetical protein
MGNPVDPAATLPALEEVEQALRASWTFETSDAPDSWTPENPAEGQCTATTLTIQALYGGQIVAADVLDGEGRSTGRQHAWNVLPSGEEVDFTFSQFHDAQRLGPDSPCVPEVTGDGSRVKRLAERVSTLLGVPVTPNPAA